MILKNTSNFPSIPKEVVESLNKAFPMKDFGANTEHSSLLFHYGQRSVINFLTSKYNEQNETIINKEE
jgi:hypothetical protein